MTLVASQGGVFNALHDGVPQEEGQEGVHQQGWLEHCRVYW